MLGEDYRKARKEGRRQMAEALSRGVSPYLPALDDMLAGRLPAGELPMGIREIPVSLIAGTRSSGRQPVFSHNFFPVAEESSEFAAKWSALLEQQLDEGIRDPIVVYEYLQRFYVQEGNKRVSVARYLDMPSIAASVTRVLPPRDAEISDELLRYREFERFFRVAPLYGLRLSKAGDYAKLARLCGRNLEDEWEEEAVRKLASSFALFEAAFQRHAAKRILLEPADAFLLYLEAYATSNPLNASSTELDERIKAMWDELDYASHQKHVAYDNQPPSKRRSVASAVADKVLPHKTLKLAFIYDRSPKTSGWAALHEQGRCELEEQLNGIVETMSFTGCSTEKAFDEAVDEAELQGCEAIITPSPRQMEQSLRAAVAHPKLKIFNCAVNLSSSSVRSFHARMYEVKFLLGVLAASLSPTRDIGYAAFSPIFGTIAEVNAFALGVQLIAPQVTIHLRWLSAEDADWEKDLFEQGVRVISGRDYPNPENSNEAFGVYSLGEKPDGSWDEGHHVFAKPLWDWARCYELLMRALEDASWRKDKTKKGLTHNYWWGLSTSIVGYEMSKDVAPSQCQLLEILKRSIIEGITSPFDGTIVNQQGQCIHQKGQPRMSDSEIASMSWLCSNIEGTIPRGRELSGGGRADVEVAGAAVESLGTDAL
ncbi:MAG: BMP family ABC transporter substrate-binding protein [Atopobiaceae bacterium]|nr:BMP family ABC transporter substrate-binding protein [Atopobiaceae bacterium]